ncbi:MAG: GNAT family N-acetyltransferase [Candidatus Lokiarchaeota archaeon]|nr:GNAT family N-acetyltransferase [Candidatus Lokiarchaeota archaeon]
MINLETAEYNVRPCKYEELQKVILINETTLPEHYPTYFYEQIIEKYPESFMVAELKKEPGKLAAYIMWRIERGISSFGIQLVKKGHLVSLAVSEPYRRKKIASSLLKNSMLEVKDYGVDEFVLEVRISNQGAIDLYQKTFGFKKIRIIEQYYRDGENAYYMALKVDDLNFDKT